MFTKKKVNCEYLKGAPVIKMNILIYRNNDLKCSLRITYPHKSAFAFQVLFYLMSTEKTQNQGWGIYGDIHENGVHCGLYK